MSPGGDPRRRSDARRGADKPYGARRARAGTARTVHQRGAPSGPAFAGPIATASCAACRSRPTGRSRRRSQMWRRPIGPGWSSFAVSGDLFYTQEQRGGDEIVSCYRVTTGEAGVAASRRGAVLGIERRCRPARHADARATVASTRSARPESSTRSTPSAAPWCGRATSAADAGAKMPMWGFSSSPLVVDDVVIVAAGGKLGAYDVATGTPRWSGGGGGSSYSSPHLADDRRRRAGRVLERRRHDQRRAGRRHSCSGSTRGRAARSFSRRMTADGDVLVNTVYMNGGIGLRRVSVAHGSGGWTRRERWTSIGLKPYFNDFVVHNGHAYGFDGSILVVHRSAGRHAQVEGRALRQRPARAAGGSGPAAGAVGGRRARAGQGDARPVHRGRAVSGALEGKTWNHPVVVGDVLLVRNGEEMAAFRLSVPKSEP